MMLHTSPKKKKENSNDMFEKEQLQKEILELLEEKETYLKYHKIEAFFPETGPFRKELYPKHVAFMYAGKEYMQRAMISANRTGKTLTCACEVTYHLTGLYPKDWKGRVFPNAIQAWAAGITNQSTKEIQQYELIGDINDPGTGFIPKECILDITRKPGVPDAIESVRVKHISGDVSILTFKSYDQKRDAFQGTKKQLIWLDEEPRDSGIYTECLTRLMDEFNPGIIICSFTPLFGLSDVVLSFLEDGKFPIDNVVGYKYVTNITWDDVPHLTPKQKEELLATYPKHQRDARTKGIPALGAGAIYPYSEDDIVVEPFQIPAWWAKVYGLDVGWNKTAAVWLAMDPDTRVCYAYSEHYAGESHPAIHASAIKSRGEWMTGAIDPASAGANQVDGRALFDLYEQEGLHLVSADNSTEAGTVRVSQMFESGALKIFSSCLNLINEIRVYRRDENGKIVKKNDHAVDALRYACMTGLDWMDRAPDPDFDSDYTGEAQSRDSYTGY